MTNTTIFALEGHHQCFIFPKAYHDWSQLKTVSTFDRKPHKLITNTTDAISYIQRLTGDCQCSPKNKMQIVEIQTQHAQDDCRGNLMILARCSSAMLKLLKCNPYRSITLIFGGISRLMVMRSYHLYHQYWKLVVQVIWSNSNRVKVAARMF